jgi:hypothetical protein
MKELKMDDASPKILLIPADRPLAVQAVAAVVDYVAHVGATKIQIYTGTQLDSDSLFGGFVFGGFVSQIMSMLPPDSCSSLFTPDLNPTGSGTVPNVQDMIERLSLPSILEEEQPPHHLTVFYAPRDVLYALFPESSAYKTPDFRPIKLFHLPDRQTR